MLWILKTLDSSLSVFSFMAILIYLIATLFIYNYTSIYLHSRSYSTQRWLCNHNPYVDSFIRNILASALTVYNDARAVVNYFDIKWKTFEVNADIFCIDSRQQGSTLKPALLCFFHEKTNKQTKYIEWQAWKILQVIKVARRKVQRAVCCTHAGQPSFLTFDP